MNTELVKKDEQRDLETVNERPTVRPAVDIYENSDEYLVVADLPAISKDALQIHLEGSQLTIEGQMNNGVADGILEQEFQVANYRRRFELPEFVDRDKVAAELKHGVLSLRLPKTEAVKPKQIQVRAG